jgi:hypothetical protein
MRVLFVHGRSQGGKDRSELKATWLSALEKGLKRSGLVLSSTIDTDFPFYADRLDDFVRQFGLPADPAIAPKGSPAFQEYESFRAQVAEEMRERAKISVAEVHSEMGDHPREKGLENWAWVQAIVRLLDRKLTGVSEGTIEAFLRDVFLYCRRSGVRRQIDEIVSSELKADTNVVVGHSLGSVVAYNVLRNASARPVAFVTVGSPLGIRAIRSSLGRLANPSGAKGWYNAYDPADIVSLYPLDGGNFDVSPSITNNGTVKNWTENRHGIIGYLDDLNVARAVYEALI